MDLRLASVSPEFPYGSDTVPFILFKGGKFSYAKSRRDKLDMLAQRGGKILAVWPGKWSSDAFEVDDRLLARRVLQQAKFASLADLEYAEHQAGAHRVKAVRIANPAKSTSMAPTPSLRTAALTARTAAVR
jgi:hypothetical protein